MKDLKTKTIKEKKMKMKKGKLGVHLLVAANDYMIETGEVPSVISAIDDIELGECQGLSEEEWIDLEKKRLKSDLVKFKKISIYLDENKLKELFYKEDEIEAEF